MRRQTEARPDNVPSLIGEPERLQQQQQQLLFDPSTVVKLLHAMIRPRASDMGGCEYWNKQQRPERA